jgi:hypothetical protein
MKIYVEQYGSWWSFSADEWRKMLEDMLEKEIDMDDYGHRLKGVPYHNVSAYRTVNTEGYSVFSYYAKDTKKAKLYSMVCDWNKDNIKDTLNEFNIKNRY